MHALYQEKLLAWARTARASDAPDKNGLYIAKRNPVCGDEVRLSLTLTQDKISHIGMDVRGCALCEAGAGLFGHLVQGADISHLNQLSDDIAAFLADKQAAPIDPALSCLTPVKAVSNRHKCVTLSFEAGRALCADYTHPKKP